MKIRTYDQAEAATEAARLCYERLVRQAAREAHGERELSRKLGYSSPSTVGNALSKGKFSAIRRIATACKQYDLI